MILNATPGRGVSLPLVAEVVGWSGATMAHVAKRYGHINEAAISEALTSLDVPTQEAERELKQAAETARVSVN